MNDTPEQRVEDADDCPYCGGSEEVEARVADGRSDYIPCPHPVHRLAHQPQGDSAALREALKPFAEVADEYDDREDDSFEVWIDAGPNRNIRATFRLEMYRRARAALNAFPATPAEPVTREAAIERAATYVLDNSRRSNASLNDEQRDADTNALMAAYRDIIGKALDSGFLALTDRTEQVRAEERERLARVVEDYDPSDHVSCEEIANLIRTSASQEKSNG